MPFRREVFKSMSDKIKLQRMCVSCRTRRKKQEFLRVVRCFDTGVVKLDDSGNSMGRGAYVCQKKACIEKCIKTSAFNRAFKKNVSAEVYESLGSNFSQNIGGDCV